MRIVHVDLTGPFTEGMNYQENMLSGINAQDGHEVYFIATNLIWENNQIKSVEAIDKKLDNGVHLIRMPYINLILPILTDKLRAVKGLTKRLEHLQPDVIMLHGYQTLSVIPIVKYLKYNKNVKLAVDTHADALNSAQNVFSKMLLHKFLYTLMGKKVLKYTKKIWCISRDVMLFSEKVNKIPAERLEYYPLGGKLFDTETYIQKRKNIREIYNIADNDILLVHSGKMSISKKTIEIVRALKETTGSRLKLLVVGTMDNDVREEVQKLIQNDTRVCDVGWKSGEELLDILCAADVYVQPGTQSATMQSAMCCGCALVLYPYESHKYLLDDSVFYVKDYADIEQLLKRILNNPQLIEEKRKQSFAIAKEMLDYKKLAYKLYEL